MIAGLGTDSVTTGAGNDVIIGDNGSVIFDANDVLISIVGAAGNDDGVDTINAGAGRAVIIGGGAGDMIDSDSAAANNVIIGDGGEATFATEGSVLTASTNDIAIGAADNIFITEGTVYYTHLTLPTLPAA